MKTTNLNGRLLRSTIMTSVIAAFAMPAMAQPVETIAADDDADAAASDGDRIVVTGSRIARDSYGSAAPLQNLNVDAAREIGVTGIADLLQRSTVANGQQNGLDIFTSAGSDNATEPPSPGGAGSANIGLRGLDPERTLILLNGRRLGPGGIRGGPPQADLNLIPFSLVENITIVTEGASAVYGADAVAGVVDLQLRNDFEGFEINTNFTFPEAGGGEVKQIGFIMGGKTDRANFVFGGEYFQQNPVTNGQREPCAKSVARTMDGEIQSVCASGLFDNVVINLDPSFGAGLGFMGDFLGIFYTPGQTNIGVPDFSDAQALSATAPPNLTGSAQPGCDPNVRADLRCRFPFDPFFGEQDEILRGHLVTGIERYSFMGMGSYDVSDVFGGSAEVYFEGLFSTRTTEQISATEQIFPGIAIDIPMEDANGNLLVNPDGSLQLFDNPLNPFNSADGFALIAPIVTLDQLSQITDAELNQTRFVSGLRGDFGGGWLEENRWSYDLFASYDRNVGFASVPVLDGGALELSQQTLRFDASGNLICGVIGGANAPGAGFEGSRPCVVVDFFAPDIFTGGFDGRFTNEEAEFLVADRLNRTVVEQGLISGYVTGDFFTVPWTGDKAAVAFGGEWRKDRINSQVESLGQKGLNAAENKATEGRTKGSRDLFDLYAEIVIPVLDNVDIEGAIRYTDESNFGSKETYRARFTWDVAEWMTLSGSYGTSFRAPNLREQFLGDQFGSTGSDADPCSVPDTANVGGVYTPAGDTRTQTVLDNCVLNGANPFLLGLGAGTSISVQVGGAVDDLTPETSRSYTATILLSPPVADSFDLDIAVSFFDIKVKNNITSLAPATILARCFGDAPGLASPFCSRVIPRRGVLPILDFVGGVDASFVNVGEEISQGVDVNVRIAKELGTVGGAPLDVSLSSALTFQTKRTQAILQGDPIDNLRGDFGLPKKRLNSTAALNWSGWQFLANARYLDGTIAPNETLLAESDCTTFSPSETFIGVQTQSVCEAESRWYLDISLGKEVAEGVRLTAGISNVLDKEPPLVSGDSNASRRTGRIVSSGYDQIQRSFFINATASF